jgi:hypothetical protein
MVIAVYNGANVLVYSSYNGTWVTGAAATGAVDAHSSDDLLIGDRVNSNRCFNGKIGLLYIWNGIPLGSATNVCNYLYISPYSPMNIPLFM